MCAQGNLPDCLCIIDAIMDWAGASAIGWLFDGLRGASDRLIPRWLFLRALGIIYFSASFSLIFQIRGLIGPAGILPAGSYLQAVAQSLAHWQRWWYAPTLLWFSSGSVMLSSLCWAGMLASVLLVINLWPRGMLAVCFVCFLSFVSAAQDFSGYQSDGMLLEAGFIALFFAPAGIRPGWGEESRPSRASLFLLVWEGFRIYFESGVAKIMGGDPQWRNFTALDEYYQNGPLPTWIGWHMQHFPHWFHAATSFGTLALEFGLVWMMFLPRRFRMVCFCIVTPWQIGIILSANYTFLNYLVLALGFLLLDDKLLERFVPERWKRSEGRAASDGKGSQAKEQPAGLDLTLQETLQDRKFLGAQEVKPEASSERHWQPALHKQWAALTLAMMAVMLSWIFYATAVEMIWMVKQLELRSEEHTSE